MLVEAEGAGRVPPQLGWQGPARCVRLLVRAPLPHPSPCIPGSASGALPWPGGRGQPRAAPDLLGRKLDREIPGAEGSQVSGKRLYKEGIPDCLSLSPNTMKSGGPAAPNFKGSGFPELRVPS